VSFRASRANAEAALCYNVWGRHDKRPGRPLVRPREEWIWSPEATHPVIVPKELFDKVEDRARHNTIATKKTPADYPTRRTRRAGRVYPLRGRVRCSLCGRRMEGTHQKGSNYYRCQFSTTRGQVAADVAGHPRSLQVREEIVLETMLQFMDRRLFGPQRLQHLRQELMEGARPDDHRPAIELKRLQAKKQEVEQALYRQGLRMEEHDDPHHPIIELAKRRIDELSTQRETIRKAIRATEAKQTDALELTEIEATLDRIPDLRAALNKATPEEIAEILEAFDITATYDKAGNGFLFSAVLTSKTSTSLNNTDRPQGAVGEIFHSGGGIETPTRDR
jgi:site-specific DNA recombinase